MDSKISIKQIKYKNVFSVRKNIPEKEVQKELSKIIMFFQKYDIKQTGPIISSTFNLSMQEDERILDIEFLIPIDKKIKSKENYKIKEVFHLVYALHKRHYGDPLKIQETYNELGEFINKHNLQQITSAYNVTVRNAESMEDIENIIIDIYIGINPSRL